jgi:hypothetical protein
MALTFGVVSASWLLGGMAIPSDARDQLALKFEVLLPHLNERQRWLLLAAEARLLGHGGGPGRCSGGGREREHRPQRCLRAGGGPEPVPGWPAQTAGRGRRSAGELDAGLVPALLALVEPDERGDPDSPACAPRWPSRCSL